MPDATFPDVLYAECSRMLSNNPASGARTRSLFAQEPLVTIVIWEVIVEGLWRLGARSLAENLWGKLTLTIQKLRQTRQQLEEQTQRATNSEVEAVIHETREDLSTLGRCLASLKDSAGPEEVQNAKAAIQKVLVEAGWSEAQADQRAQEIVTFLSNS